ncbi:MAG: hypothetical protein QM598_05925 [Protaetiibacter sp.]
MSQKQTPQQLVHYLRGRGLSITEIADELHRSPRMVRKILDGSSRGELYRATLEQLAATGRASTVPPRRRTRDGQLVKVRGGARGEKTVTPVDEGGTYSGTRQGGRLTTSTNYLAGGGRQHELHLPKGKAAKGRVEADSAIVSKVRAAAKGQARGNQKKIRTVLTFANGRVMEVNEYNASTMLQRIQESGGSALDWLRSESALRYTNLDVSKVPITGVTMTVFEPPKTRQYEDFKAAGRPRQRRALTRAELARMADNDDSSTRGGKR